MGTELVDNAVTKQNANTPHLTPQQEYNKFQRKRKCKRFGFFLLALAECFICFVFFIGTKSEDLDYRVVREIENRISGQNDFSAGTFTGETDFGYFIGEGTFNYKSGSVYTGQWTKNHLHGLGVLNIPSEGIYEGEFEYSDKSGHGVFTWNDGAVYDGEWKSDGMDGQGTYRSSDGIEYIGVFGDNRFKSGTCCFSNETGTYDVLYKDFCISSIEITFHDGTTYIGGCNGEVLDDVGTMTFPTGDSYTGKFSGGHRTGQGVYTWNTGDKYDGDWIDDAMSGTGIYTYSDGSCAQGVFSQNSFTDGSYTVSNDFGAYIFTVEDGNTTAVSMELKSGTTYSCDMTEGKLTGTARISYSNGDSYSGRVQEGYKTGQGTYIWSNGAVYEGKWSEDKMNGQGTYFYPSGSEGYKLIGMFKDGVPDGTCTYYVSLGESYKTDWSNGTCVKIYE